MKGVYLKGAYEIEMKEMEVPIPLPGQALIKVKSAGICGSDIGAYRGANPLVQYPTIIGHEVAGEVMSIEENEKGIKKGDHVILNPYLYCGTCYPCSIGRTNCCENLKVLGVHVDGGMSEYFTHPKDMLIKVPNDMSWDLIPIAEPLTISLHAIHRLRLKRGEHITIFGAGPIGLLATMAAKQYGAIPIVIDIVPERLKKAKEIGAVHTINSKEENVEKKVLEFTNGRKSEAVMEASGSNQCILMAFDIISNAGRLAFTGWPKAPTLLSTDIVTKKEIDILGSRTSVGEFEEAIDLIYHHKINVESILTKTVTLDEAIDVIQDIEKNPGNYLKVNVLI